MLSLGNSRYKARFAGSWADIHAAQALRHRCFVAGQTGRAGISGRDADEFDDRCRHVLVEDTRSGQLVCCFRLLPLTAGAEIGQSYSAQFYGLSGLSNYDGRMVEVGRFCLHPDVKDADVLRVAWGALTRFVDEGSVGMLFGCSSFHGTDTGDYLDAFAMLKARHLAPKHWLPKIKAPNVFCYGARLRRRPDLRRAMQAMPPLLKTYLMMGGWVSDHAVVDAHMNTLHVFTALEIDAIPPARARALRMAAAS